MKYFAYGSNMSEARLRGRVSSAITMGAFVLEKHELRFHKISYKDGSAKCDAYLTGSGDDFIMGVLFDFEASEKADLDRCEGLGNGYSEKDISIVGSDGVAETAFTYYATAIDESLKPFCWYKHHVLVGAESANLPSEYILRIQAIDTDEDLDEQRKATELAIYR